MKSLYKSLLVAAVLGGSLATGLTSCNFLDVVPDERPGQKETWSDREAGLKYLYSCYALLPRASWTNLSLDLFTGDEVVTPFEHETFNAFPKGNYSASTPVISYWNDAFRGIRQCYMFLDAVDKLPNTSDEEKADYKAQAKFLIAYFHYQLLLSYGPISIIETEIDINMPQEQYPNRRPLDECVSWIANKLDEAAEGLPVRREQKSRFGLATKMAAKGLKAKLLVYAASPLFNGGSNFYTDFKDKQGNLLMPQSPDPQKWIRARDAVKEAIDLAESNGYALYEKDNFRDGESDANRYPAVGVVRRLRTLIVDWKQPHVETFFAETRAHGFYDVTAKSLPLVQGDAEGYNGAAPTWAMVSRFYTKNGLPWDEDPAYKDSEKLAVVTVGTDNQNEAHLGAKTIAFNLNREPRFYAWIGFQGGYYEIQNGDQKPYPTPAYMPAGMEGRVLLDFTRNGNQGRKNRNSNFSHTGYLNKKYVDPNLRMQKSTHPQETYPHPLMRLADLYLLYAESCVETGELDIAKTYLNKVRVRAGIPTVETSWAMVPGVTLNQQKLRQIVRQERMIEFYLENQNFWDLRRWLEAERYFNVKAQGLNIEGTTVEQLANIKEVSMERKFSSPRNYLMPIPSADVNRNLNIVQNPGY